MRTSAPFSREGKKIAGSIGSVRISKRRPIALGEEVDPDAAESQRARRLGHRPRQLGGQVEAEERAAGGAQAVEVGAGADRPAVGGEQCLEQATGWIGGGQGTIIRALGGFSASSASTLPAMEASGTDTTEREAPDRPPAEASGDAAEAAGAGVRERDTTDEWRLAPDRTPATVAELEGRIEVAMATAKAAEEAALEIGAASLEAAEQARRAAALAERASAAAARAAAGRPAARAPHESESAGSAPESAEHLPAPGSDESASDEPAPESDESASDEPAPESGAPKPVKPARPEPVFPFDELRPGERRAAAPRRPDPFDERIDAFRLRAEKVMLRLQRIEARGAPGAVADRSAVPSGSE